MSAAKYHSPDGATDSDRLKKAWERATDKDILAAAFPPRASYTYQSLAVVYREFIRRDLDVPVEPTDRGGAQTQPMNRWAVAAGGLVTYLVTFTLCYFLWLFVLSGVGPGRALNPITFLALLICLAIPPGLALIGYMTKRQKRFQPDPEGYTRCGSCGYILTGLTEPRCPECGHRL